MKTLVALLTVLISSTALGAHCARVVDHWYDENGKIHTKSVPEPCGKDEFAGLDFSKPDPEYVIIPPYTNSTPGAFTIRGPHGDTTYVPQADGTLKAVP